MYIQQQRSGTGNKSTRMCDQHHQEWFDWVGVHRKQCNTENGADIACVKQKELVERTPFPSFNGSQQSWAEFKRVFQDLISVSGHRIGLNLAQLAAKLPEEARMRIEGGAEPEEARRQLGERYGDKDLAVLSTI